MAIDWSCPGSAVFQRSLAATHALVADMLQRLSAANYEPKLIAAGHAHIDCAWLWEAATCQTASRWLDNFWSAPT